MHIFYSSNVLELYYKTYFFGISVLVYTSIPSFFEIYIYTHTQNKCIFHQDQHTIYEMLILFSRHLTNIKTYLEYKLVLEVNYRELFATSYQRSMRYTTQDLLGGFEKLIEYLLTV